VKGAKKFFTTPFVPPQRRPRDSCWRMVSDQRQRLTAGLNYPTPSDKFTSFLSLFFIQKVMEEKHQYMRLQRMRT
jgi:hypothetical protein